MTVSKLKEGEEVWRREFPDRVPAGLSTECARVWLGERLLRAFRRVERRLDRLVYFTEGGYDVKRGGFWIVVGAGDNCLRIMP